MAENTIYKTEKSRDILLDFYDAVMSKWPFPYTKAMIPTRAGETHVLTAGSRDNPALVLLHGAASNVLGWGGAIPVYMKDFHVIAPDIPGEVGRSAPTRPSWLNDDYVLWLDDLLDGLNISKAALMGLSFGGWIAARFAASHPEKVNSLVLLAPGGIVPARTSAILKTIWYSMQKKNGADKMKRMVFGNGMILPEVSRFFDLIQENYNPRFGSPALLSDEEIGAITCPVMMMAGGEDVFFNAIKASARLKALLPDARIFVNPDEQHGIMEYGGMAADFLTNGCK